MRVESDLSSSGFPGSFFTNDPAARVRGGSPTSFNFDLLDTEKGRKGSIDTQGDGLMGIRPYTLETTKYSAHSISFDTSKNASNTPAMVALPTTHSASAAIIKALKKGNEKALPAVEGDDEERSPIQPLPEVHFQITPCKERRLRRETPSLMTQATCMSTNSSCQAVITFAKKDPVLSATARTVATGTVHPGRAPSPVDTVMPHESNPSIDWGIAARPSLQRDSHGKI